MSDIHAYLSGVTTPRPHAVITPEDCEKIVDIVHAAKMKRRESSPGYTPGYHAGFVVTDKPAPDAKPLPSDEIPRAPWPAQPAGDDAAPTVLLTDGDCFALIHEDEALSENDKVRLFVQHGWTMRGHVEQRKVADLRAKLAEAEERADEMEGKAGEWIAKHIHDDIKHQLREAKSDAERAKADRNGMHVKNYAEWQKAIAELHLARMDADRASELRYESRDRADRAEAERDHARAELAEAVALLRDCEAFSYGILGRIRAFLAKQEKP